MVDTGEARLVTSVIALAAGQFAAVDCRHVGQMHELQSRLVAQKSGYLEKIAGLYSKVNLAVRALNVQHGSRKALLELCFDVLKLHCAHRIGDLRCCNFGH